MRLFIGRPEKRLPDGPLAEFAGGLRALRRSAGLTYREMAERTYVAASQLSRAASGTVLPHWDVTKAFVTACGGDENQWRIKWEDARRLQAASERAERRKRGDEPCSDD